MSCTKGQKAACVSFDQNHSSLLVVPYLLFQFSVLSAPIELVPAVGVENALLLVQQAIQLGGLDFVLVHPDLLHDRSQVR